MSIKMKSAYLTILVIFILSFSSVFASSTVKFDLDSFIEEFDYIPEEVKETIINESTWETVKQYNEQYDYIFINAWFGSVNTLEWTVDGDKSHISFLFTNSPEVAIWQDGAYGDKITFEKGITFFANGKFMNNSTDTTLSYAYGFFVYSEPSTTGSIRDYYVTKERYYNISRNWGMDYTYNREGFPFSMDSVSYLDGYEPKPIVPYFEFYDDVFTKKVDMGDWGELDMIPLETITNNFILGKVIDSDFNNIGLIQITKCELDGSLDVTDYFRDLYRKDTIVNGKLTGYLNPVFNESDVYEYSDTKLPITFLEKYKIYQISCYDKNLNFTYQSKNFVIADSDYSGDIIVSGDSNNKDNSGTIIDGILNGLLGLFIPGADFFQNYFDELNTWFSERLGLLYYPIELIIDFTDRVLAIDFDNPTLEIGPYKFPQFDNVEIVPKLTFDFNSYIENETFKWIHDTYLIIIDGLIVFGLVQLIHKKYEEVMTK